MELDNVIVGGSAGILTRAYIYDSDRGFHKGYTSALFGASLDVTLGNEGDFEFGIGWRRFGIGLNLEDTPSSLSIRGVSGHFSFGFPPSLIYFSVDEQ